ncbi:MAG: hypothetical protein JSS75_01915 [Bacteroidetes bacterium]|nr:hypothetical protein [Bacteroidota bacterium]
MKKNFWNSSIASAIRNLKIADRILKGKYLGARETKDVERIVKVTLRTLNVCFDGSWPKVRRKLRSEQLEWLLDTYLPV